MESAHCFVAEISDHNPNVMIEIGRMEVFDRPLLLLRRSESNKPPADLRERLYVEYSPDSDDLVNNLREEILKNVEFCGQEGERYLSQVLLRRESGLNEEVCKKIAGHYESCKQFLNASANDVSSLLDIQEALVVAAQESVASSLSKLDAAAVMDKADHE